MRLPKGPVDTPAPAGHAFNFFAWNATMNGGPLIPPCSDIEDIMKAILILSVIALSLGACANPRDNRLGEGAVIGGAGGAIVGGAVTNSPGGAIVGGVIGAAAGTLAADATRPHQHERVCHYDPDLDRRVCHYRD
jgi:hypothetical protein